MVKGLFSVFFCKKKSHVQGVFASKITIFELLKLLNVKYKFMNERERLELGSHWSQLTFQLKRRNLKVFSFDRL